MCLVCSARIFFEAAERICLKFPAETRSLPDAVLHFVAVTPGVPLAPGEPKMWFALVYSHFRRTLLIYVRFMSVSVTLLRALRFHTLLPHRVEHSAVFEPSNNLGTLAVRVNFFI